MCLCATRVCCMCLCATRVCCMCLCATGEVIEAIDSISMKDWTEAKIKSLLMDAAYTSVQIHTDKRMYRESVCVCAHARAICVCMFTSLLMDAAYTSVQIHTDKRMYRQCVYVCARARARYVYVCSRPCSWTPHTPRFKSTRINVCIERVCVCARACDMCICVHVPAHGCCLHLGSSSHEYTYVYRESTRAICVHMCTCPCAWMLLALRCEVHGYTYV